MRHCMGVSAESGEVQTSPAVQNRPTISLPPADPCPEGRHVLKEEKGTPNCHLGKLISKPSRSPGDNVWAGIHLKAIIPDIAARALNASQGQEGDTGLHKS